MLLEIELGYLDKILVEVKETNGNYSIVDNYKTEALVTLGFDIEEINAMRKITIHDEILVNPDISEL